MDSKISEAGLELLIDTALYSQEVIFKCFYWYSGRYDVEILTTSSHSISVRLKPKKGPDWEPSALLEQIRKDLIDFRLRDIVTRETQTIRELIIAKAFAYADLAQNPVTDVSDPVGFDPALIH